MSNNQRKASHAHQHQQQHQYQQLLFGPYDEESRLALECEVDPGEPAAQVSWWKLVSVSSLPPEHHFRAGRSKLPYEFAIDSNIAPSDTILTTVTLEKDNHASLEAARSKRDYFVALHSSNTNPAFLRSIELPFNDGHRLRHWARVREQVSSKDPLSGRVNSIMEISSLSRTNFGEEFICLARNNDLSAPLNASLKLDLNRKYSDSITFTLLFEPESLTRILCASHCSQTCRSKDYEQDKLHIQIRPENYY